MIRKMDRWEEITNEMLKALGRTFTFDEAPLGLRERLEKTALMCKATGGELRSRQVIASIISKEVL